MQINWLFLTGILRTMREEAATAEGREENINPAALAQFALMIEDALQKGGATMPRTTQTVIDDYSQQLEQMTLAGEDLLKLEAIFKAIEVMIEKDPFDTVAKRLACVGHELAKDRAEYFIDSADDLEETIEQLEAEKGEV
ncbi:hypothetical protein ACT3R7_06885 [Halomonas sp. AOP43-A1-21]